MAETICPACEEPVAQGTRHIENDSWSAGDACLVRPLAANHHVVKHSTRGGKGAVARLGAKRSARG